MNQLRFAVLGAGHGGMAMAGHLGLMGYPVKMSKRSASRLGCTHESGSHFVTGRFVGSDHSRHQAFDSFGGGHERL